MPIPSGTTTAAEFKESLHVLTFDLYGTVVAMQSGLTEAVTPYLQSKCWSGRPQSFVTWWRRTHFESSMIDALIDRGHTPYREICRRAATLTLERAGIPYTQGEVSYLVSQIEQLRPFDDVIDALERLKTRYKLVILSNGDPTCSTMASRTSSRVRSVHLDRNRWLLQATLRRLSQGR